MNFEINKYRLQHINRERYDKHEVQPQPTHMISLVNIIKEEGATRLYKDIVDL